MNSTSTNLSISCDNIGIDLNLIDSPPLFDRIVSAATTDSEINEADVETETEIELETESIDSQRNSPHNINSNNNNNNNCILVTGGAGFIGSHTSAALLELGYTVIIIDEMNDYYDISIKQNNINELSIKYGSNRVIFYEFDINNLDRLISIYNKYKFTNIIHLAARAGVRPSLDNPSIYLHSNINGTLALLELCKYATSANIHHFIYASSSSVYGNNNPPITGFNELLDNTNNPVSIYAATKKTCELLSSTYSSLYNIKCTGLRFFTVYGPSGRIDMAPFKFIDRIYRGLPIDQYGDGTSTRDFTYITDIVNGILLVLQQRTITANTNNNNNLNSIYNLGSGAPVQLNKFITTIERLLNKKAIINYLPSQPGDVQHTRANINKANNELGYLPSISIELGLKQTIKWYLENYSNQSKSKYPSTNNSDKEYITNNQLKFSSIDTSVDYR